MDGLRALPGVGEYTASAVAAFAYGQRTPVVDTNVRRMVARAVRGRGDAGPATTRADIAAVEALLPESPALAARASVAFMELGALVCTARTPECVRCPVRSMCAWRLAGRPQASGPSRRPQRYAGTDRQVRGLLLAVLRESSGPVTSAALDTVWLLTDQRERALSGLLSDGLVEALPDGRYCLAAEGGASTVGPDAPRRSLERPRS